MVHNILFICNQNQNRSKTAEILFKNKFNTKSAGLYNDQPVSKKQLSWANSVVVMEDDQRSEIAKRFPSLYLQKRILSLEIPDIFRFKDTKLIKEIQEKMDEYLELFEP